MSQINKRVLKDISDGRTNLKRDFGILIEPEERDYYKVHFILPGPEDTPFEGGLYHGMIRLNSNHPHGAPNIYIITPNGRFTHEDYPIPNGSRGICTTDTAYHPEMHTPMKNIETFLKGFISLMCDPNDQGAGGMVSTNEQKKKFARESIERLKNDTIVAQLFTEFHKSLIDGTFKPVKMADLNKKTVELNKVEHCVLPPTHKSIEKKSIRPNSKKIDTDSDDDIVCISESDSNQSNKKTKHRNKTTKSQTKSHKKYTTKISTSTSETDSEESEEIIIIKQSNKKSNRKSSNKVNKKSVPSESGSEESEESSAPKKKTNSRKKVTKKKSTRK